MREQECKDPWLFLEAKIGFRAQHIGKHCLRLKVTNTALDLQLQTLTTVILSSSAITVTNIILGTIAALSTVLAGLIILGAKRVSTATDSMN